MKVQARKLRIVENINQDMLNSQKAATSCDLELAMAETVNRSFEIKYKLRNAEVRKSYHALLSGVSKRRSGGWGLQALKL